MLKHGWYVAKALFSPLVLGTILFVGALRTLGYYDFGSPNHSLEEMLYHIYGGLGWDQLSFSTDSPREIASWLMIFMPSLLGLAVYLPQEMGSRIYMALHRYKSESHWWAVQTLGAALFIGLVMAAYALTTLGLGLLGGMKGISMMIPDADGFLTPSVWIGLLPLLACGLQMFQFALIFTVSFLLFRDSRVSVFLYIAPMVLGIMAYSNEEVAASVHGFVNWGMARRYNLFYPFGMTPGEALEKLLIFIAVLALVGILAARWARPAARKNR